MRLKQIGMAALATSALVVFVGPSASADTPMVVAAPRTLTVSGHGEAGGVPDQAMLSAGVTTQAKTAAAAVAENANEMTAVFAALKKLGVPDKKIQTSNFTVSPQYPPYSPNATGQQKIVGYEVTNQVNVTLDDVKKLGLAIDALVTAGANQINSVSFGIADTKPLMADARGDAVADARTRAETYARAAGVSLGSILTISDSTVAIAPPVPMLRAQLAEAKATPIAAGEEQVSADVTIVWGIR